MTAAYFEDHPTDPDKVILRKPKHDFGEPWSPVSIGVDITEKGAHVIGIYALDNDTSQIFYAKFYPAPQRTWVGLTDEEVNTIYEQAEVLVNDSWVGNGTVGLMFPITLYKMFEAKLKEKNSA